MNRHAFTVFTAKLPYYCFWRMKSKEEPESETGMRRRLREQMLMQLRRATDWLDPHHDARSADFDLTWFLPTMGEVHLYELLWENDDVPSLTGLRGELSHGVDPLRAQIYDLWFDEMLPGPDNTEAADLHAKLEKRRGEILSAIRSAKLQTSNDPAYATGPTGSDEEQRESDRRKGKRDLRRAFLTQLEDGLDDAVPSPNNPDAETEHFFNTLCEVLRFPLERGDRVSLHLYTREGRKVEGMTFEPETSTFAGGSRNQQGALDPTRLCYHYAWQVEVKSKRFAVIAYRVFQWSDGAWSDTTTWSMQEAQGGDAAAAFRDRGEPTGAAGDYPFAFKAAGWDAPMPLPTLVAPRVVEAKWSAATAARGDRVGFSIKVDGFTPEAAAGLSVLVEGWDRFSQPVAVRAPAGGAEETIQGTFTVPPVDFGEKKVFNVKASLAWKGATATIPSGDLVVDPSIQGIRVGVRKPGDAQTTDIRVVGGEAIWGESGLNVWPELELYAIALDAQGKDLGPVEANWTMSDADQRDRRVALPFERSGVRTITLRPPSNFATEDDRTFAVTATYKKWGPQLTADAHVRVKKRAASLAIYQTYGDGRDHPDPITDAHVEASSALLQLDAYILDAAGAKMGRAEDAVWTYLDKKSDYPTARFSYQAPDARPESQFEMTVTCGPYTKKVKVWLAAKQKV